MLRNRDLKEEVEELEEKVQKKNADEKKKQRPGSLVCLFSNHARFPRLFSPLPVPHGLVRRFGRTTKLGLATFGVMTNS